MPPVALLLVLLAALACVDTTDARARLEAPPTFSTLAALPVPPALDEAARPPTQDPREAPTPAPRGVRLPCAPGVAYVPRALADDVGDFDLVIHFHGDPTAAEGAIDHAGIQAVLVTVNLGASSNAYGERYQAPSALGDLVRAVEASLKHRLGATRPRARRVALSAWSAGYAAVLGLLAVPSSAERVDAVLLEDGPHASFRDAARRVVDERRLAPLVDFSRRALAGDVLLGWTHSAIRTLAFASTTETTSFVLAALPLDRTPADDDEGPLRRTSSADRGAFHLRGYAGTTARDHCDHLLSLSRTLLPLLRERWRG